MTEEIMTTGQLAQAVGIGVETVRYYERTGLLPKPPRTPGGHRQYSEADAKRLRFVRKAQELGVHAQGNQGIAEPQSGAWEEVRERCIHRRSGNGPNRPSDSRAE